MAPTLSTASATGSNPTNSPTSKPAPWTANLEAAATWAGSQPGNPARPRTASTRGRHRRSATTGSTRNHLAIAMKLVLGARVRICTFPGRRERMGRVGMSVGAAHLDLRKRQEDLAGK